MASDKKSSELREAKDVIQFLHQVHAICKSWAWDDPQWGPWFRGQQKAEWGLKPGFYRPRHFPKAKQEEVEYEMREEFIKRAPIMCDTVIAADEGRAEWEWYFMMQHFRMATRLLDWTDGALIALYLAVKDNRGDSNAAVWVLNPYELNRGAIGKEWVIPPSAPGVEKKYRKLLAKWLPKRFSIEYQDLPQKAVAIEPTHLVRRMSSQHSCFTIHGSDPEALDKMDVKNDPCLTKIVILDSAVKEIETELRRCGIDESTVFPDLDGL